MGGYATRLPVVVNVYDVEILGGGSCSSVAWKGFVSRIEGSLYASRTGGRGEKKSER